MAGMFDLCKMQKSMLFLIRAVGIHFLINIQNNQVLHLNFSKWWLLVWHCVNLRACFKSETDVFPIFLPQIFEPSVYGVLSIDNEMVLFFSMTVRPFKYLKKAQSLVLPSQSKRLRNCRSIIQLWGCFASLSAGLCAQEVAEE